MSEVESWIERGFEEEIVNAQRSTSNAQRSMEEGEDGEG